MLSKLPKRDVILKPEGQCNTFYIMSKFLEETRCCGSGYSDIIALDILECIYLGNLHARQFRI